MSRRNKHCMCELCAEYELDKIAEIMGCKCVCHGDDGYTGHGGLCCSVPNALFTNMAKDFGLATLRKELDGGQSDERR